MGYLRLRTYNTCFTLPLLALNAVKQRKGFLSLGYAYRMEKCAGKTFYERKNPVFHVTYATPGKTVMRKKSWLAVLMVRVQASREKPL